MIEPSVTKIEILAEEETSKNEINESKKDKCQFCDRCGTCQADFDKDKKKNKGKKDAESKCSALNYLVFIIVFVLMLASNLAVWFIMSA